MEDLGRLDRLAAGTYLIAQRAPVGEQGGRPRARDVAGQLDHIAVILAGTLVGTLHVIEHAGADVEDRYGQAAGLSQLQAHERIVESEGLERLQGVVVERGLLLLVDEIEAGADDGDASDLAFTEDSAGFQVAKGLVEREVRQDAGVEREPAVVEQRRTVQNGCGLGIGGALSERSPFLKHAEQVAVDKRACLLRFQVDAFAQQNIAQQCEALVIAGIAKAGNQVVHAGADDAGFRSLGQALDRDARLAGERGPEEQEIRHGIQVALFEAGADGLVLLAGPGGVCVRGVDPIGGRRSVNKKDA